MALFGNMGREDAERGGVALADVEAALNEWKSAVSYFESVKDPDLVDFAIYEAEAARRKYIYLLRRAGA